METLREVDVAGLLTTIGSLLSAWSLQVLGALAVLVLGRIVAGWLRRMARLALQRSGVDETVVPFLCTLLYYLVIGLVLIGVLDLFGVPATSLLAIVGAAGLAIGLALQGTLSNFAAGVMLLVLRPFRIGDFVEVGGASGSVVAIRIFTTILNTSDNVQIIMPNSLINGAVIKNYAANALRRIDLTAGVGYGDDLERVVQVLRDMLQRDPRVLDDPEPVVAVHELADSSVKLVVRPWCDRGDYWDLRWDLTRQIKEQLEGHGCSIPFPQYDVHLKRQSNADGVA